MKAIYKGFELEAKREKCMAGYDLLYYNIYRESDGWYLADSFEDSAETVREKIKQLKNIVDDYLINPQDYDED